MKTTTTISISKGVYRAGKRVAKKAKRTFSGQVEAWIEEALAEKKGAKR